MSTFYYKVELRNKSGTHLELLDNDIFSIFWSFDSLGGCGDAEIALRREFDNFGDIDMDYDVQIWRIPNPAPRPIGVRFGASGIQLDAALTGEHGLEELRWRGFVRDLVPVFDQRESVRLRCSGYSRYLEYIVVPAQTYASQDVGAAVRSIVDTYVTPKTLIQRTVALNLCEDVSVNISSTGLKFDTSAWEAIKNLAEIGGNAEWGVLPSLETYFKARSTDVKQTHVLGDRVKFYEFATTTDEVVRKVYLRGDGGFTATLTSGSPAPEANYEKERVITVASITDAADATLWGNAYFDRFKNAQEKGRLILSSTDAWIESASGQTMPPLGKLRVLGSQTVMQPGARLDARLPMRLGLTLGGTHDQSYRVVSCVYRPVGTALRIELDLGEKRSSLSDLMRMIEFKLSEIRQVAA